MNVPDRSSVPGVGHLKIAIGCLDDGWIGILAGLVFEGPEHLEVLSIR